MRRRDAEPGLALSAREHQVLQHLDGRSDKAIANELGLTAYGVRYHLRSVFSKLGVNTARRCGPAGARTGTHRPRGLSLRVCAGFSAMLDTGQNRIKAEIMHFKPSNLNFF